tara:strand:+ start:490 stop:897 length:408 start_codon:yes stop_codon:yes gene_type:complete
MGGCGGAGAPNTILGPDTSYAGGGGGTRRYSPGQEIPVASGAPGGAGGGGTGAAGGEAPSGPNNGGNATVNTGGGGGGGGDNGAGGHGGSGIVVVRGPSAVVFAGSPCCAFTGSTHPGGDKIAKFTATGTLTISK